MVKANPIGENLKRFRVQKGYSQNELCANLCSQAEISKIENGLNSPTVELIQQLAVRLQVPISLLFQEHTDEEKFFQLDRFLSDLLREEKYQEAMERINQQEVDAIVEVDILKIYIKTIIDLKQNRIDFRTAASLLSNLLNEKEVWSHSIQLFIRIKMAIANMYSEKDLFHLTESVYQELENEIEILQSNNHLNALLKIYFNHCQILEYQGKSEDSIAIAKKGYELCLLHNHTFLFGHFYYQLAHYHEQSGEDEMSLQKQYSVAYTLFHAFEHDVRKQMILRMKEQYILFEF
ncbi:MULTISPECIES: helix-turn-helix domain-containing protein [unclassified Exiguobacterium]|uniref:helix-turn-helix domain-containing protein n=1 Tax=unclassified Exiguobacterium TaxID=2644629 RepID=UPI0025C388CA|nr:MULTISPECIES: helix-turn-helix domain-containing protein [unclassified Exiguobacterium]